MNMKAMKDQTFQTRLVSRYGVEMKENVCSVAVRRSWNMITLFLSQRVAVIRRAISNSFVKHVIAQKVQR